jgi:peptide chain release factor subunit 1
MTITVTPNLLKDLATFRARNGCALSFYLGLDPSATPTIPDVDAKFRARLNEAEKLADDPDLDRDCRMAVRDDLTRLTEWWDQDFERGGLVHGLAVFTSSADNFFLVVPLPTPVSDATHLGEDLLLAPLIGRLADVDTLVAVVSREQGRLYRLRGGQLEEILDESEEQPGQHDQGGWSQARYQRHIDHLVQQHLKAVGEAIDRKTRGVRALQLAVICPEEMRSSFSDTLSQEARDAIAGFATAEAHASPGELLQVVQPLLDEADARRTEDAIERYRQEAGRGGRASAGWQDTLDAAADTRVDTLLVVEGANQRVYQCPECRRGFVEDGTCPIDDLALVPRDDGLDVALRHVLANSGSAMRVGGGALGDVEIGALLRF